MRSANRRLAVAAAALGTVTACLLSGATVGTADASTTDARTVAPGQTVQVSVRADHTVVMPATVQPGFATYAVRSARAAGFQIVQASPGYTKRAAAHDINRTFTKNDVRALRRFEAHMTLFGGVGTTPGKPATLTARLRPGTYWALDTSPTRLDPARILTFHVSGSYVGGALSGHVIRAVDATKWGSLSQRIPTHGTILFQNRATENHFVVLARLAKGKTMADFRRWVQQAKQGKQVQPPLSMRGELDSGALSPHRSASFSYRLSPGHYVLMCFWPDADMGGVPHVLMGMYRPLTVG